MKYLKKYDNFTPIKINSAKPFKIKKNLDKSIDYLQRGISSLRKRIEKEKNIKKRADMNRDVSAKIQKLSDLNFQKLKQIEYLRNNPIQENKEYSENLISILSSPDFKEDDIAKYIGFDEDDYEFKKERWGVPEISEDGCTIIIDTRELEHLANIYDEGVISWTLQLTYDYNNYEYYIDDEELNYLNNYLSDEILNNIKKMSNIFKYPIDPNEEGKIRELFEYLNLDDELDTFKNEIRYENERAVQAAASEVVESIPFEIDTNGVKTELTFDYKTIIEYMKKHNLDVKTIKEFIENVEGFNDFSYDVEYQNKYEHMGDFKDLNSEVENAVEKYTSSPDDIFPCLIEKDNLEVFKKIKELALFSYSYDIWLLNKNGYRDKRERLNLFELAKYYNGDILKWFLTDKFEKYIKKLSKSDYDAYNEFKFGEEVKKYNL